MSNYWTTYREVMAFDRRLGKRVPVRVDLWLDFDSIAVELGTKALQNKSGKSKMGIGIKAEVTRR